MRLWLRSRSSTKTCRSYARPCLSMERRTALCGSSQATSTRTTACRHSTGGAADGCVSSQRRFKYTNPRESLMLQGSHRREQVLMRLDYNRIDSELRVALEQLPSLEITRDNVQQVRTALASRPRPPSAVEVMETVDKVVTTEGEVGVFIYRKSKRANQPAALWIHGGGYIIGNAADERARVIAASLPMRRIGGLVSRRGYRLCASPGAG